MVCTRSFSGYKNFRSLKITLQGTLTYPLPAGTFELMIISFSVGRVRWVPRVPFGPKMSRSLRGMNWKHPKGYMRLMDHETIWKCNVMIVMYTSMYLMDIMYVCDFLHLYAVVRAQTETWWEGRHSMIWAQESQKSTKMTYKTNRLHSFGVRYCHYSYLKRTHLPKIPWGRAVSIGLRVWLEWLAAIVWLENCSFFFLFSAIVSLWRFFVSFHLF